MARDVVVVDHDKNVIGSTYEKRAGQLVKKNRAQWIAEKSIMLLPAASVDKEDFEMDKASHMQMQNGSYESDVSYIADKSKAYGNNQYKSIGMDKKRHRGNIFKKVINAVLNSSNGYDMDISLTEIDDKVLESIVKNHMIAKRNLIIHISMYFIASIFLLIMFGIVCNFIWWYEPMIFLAVIICGWGILVAMHFILYLTRITPMKVQKAMYKLKR